MFEATAKSSASDAARPVGRGARDRAPLLSVRVAAETFVVESEAVSGIERTDRLQRNPAGGEVAGWLLGSDEDVPVLSLAARLGLEAAANARGAILRFAVGGGFRGLLVDGLERSTLGPDHRRALPAGLGRYGSCFRSALVSAERVELELDLLELAAAAPVAASPRDPNRSPQSGASADGLPPLLAGAGARRCLVFAPKSDLRTGAGERFVLPASQVLEVAGDLPLRWVPGAVAPLRGLVAWRDRAVPVFDLGAEPGGDLPRLEGAPRILIARARRRGGVLGLVVANEIRFEDLATLAGAERLEGSELERRERRTASARGLGSFMIQDRALSVPDLDSLLEYGLSF